MTNSILATGSRKTATAKVWLMPGTGVISINDQPAQNYLGRTDLMEIVSAPFRVAGVAGQFDARCVAQGGGKSAQAGAVSLGIARALVRIDPNLRGPLRTAALLKRDPREKERMKYGLAKRRKRFQWTKR